MQPRSRVYTPAPIAQHPVNDGLLAWWLALPELTGGPQWFDLNQRFKGTLTNAPTWQAGENGFAAVDFANSTNWVNCGTIDATGRDHIALGVLLYCRSTQSVAPNIRNIAGTDNTSAGSFYLRLGDSGTPTVAQWIVCIATEKKIISSVALPLLQWVYLFGYYDGVNQQLYQWSNSGGGRVATGAQTGNLSGGSTTMAIGAANNATRPFDGKIASVQVWSGGNIPDPMAAATEALTWFPRSLNRITTKVWSFPVTAAAGGGPWPWFTDNELSGGLQHMGF